MTIREQGQASGADASVGQLVERLSAQVSALVRDEMALATAEMKRKGAQAGIGLGIGGVGAVVAVLGLGALVAAAVLGLATVLAGWLAALVIGAALLVIAGVMSAAGITQLRNSAPPVPEQAVQSTKRDIETVKESVRR
ncbi:MAG: phage holin family protein [Pseudonocardiales bacterium]|nr:phage holin family protein [Pseudonocardiales bacterium]MBV9029244.1 phage holin family protein [Pseudonocardiales bacterium]MBW0009879.1 phage holin family protein [Pseudonocardiales bacterium]